MNRSPHETSFVLHVFFLIFFFATSLAAQIPDQVFVGTRPFGMGEAFVAVADDGNAISWNPAGLVRLERTQASFAQANLFGLGIRSYRASLFSQFYFAPGLADFLAIGADWSGIKFGDEELEFSRDQFHLSASIKPFTKTPYFRRASLGVNAKRLQIRGARQEIIAKIPELDASGWGWDVGMLYHLGDLRPILRFIPVLRDLAEDLNAGLVLHDVGDTRLKHETGKKESIQKQHLRWGLSYRPFPQWSWKNLTISDPVLAMDIDDRIHFGLEFWLARALGLRAGWQKGPNEEATLSFGMGLKLALQNSPDGQLDYAYTDSPILPNSDRNFDLSLILYEDPRLIRIEEARINDIFPSLYLHYASEDTLKAGELGKILLRNLYQDSLEVDVVFQARPYTKYPVAQSVKVPPRETLEVPLRAVLDSKILDVTSRQVKTGQIQATYTIPWRGRFPAKKNFTYTLHERGALTWDDRGKAAAFVTAGNRCISEFAQTVVKQDHPRSPRWHFFTRNMEYAHSLYETLRALDFKFVQDPKTPYAKIGQTKQVVDHIKYPAELLTSTKAGDCDDLSTFYASILEAVGVETALLSTPTHLLLMLNTDIPARRLNSMLVDTSLFVSHRGRLWMPVETTIFPSSFLEAWHTGAQKCLDALSQNSLEIIEVVPNQQEGRYPPAPAPDLERSCNIPVPLVTAAVYSNLEALDHQIENHLIKFDQALAQNRLDFKLRNHFAAILGQNGGRKQAREHLRFVLEKDRENVPALNNLGNIEFIEGHFSEAESYYRSANKYNPYNKGGTYWNLALLYALLMKENQAHASLYRPEYVQALTEAAAWMNKDPQQALMLLGLPAEFEGKGSPQQTQSSKSDTTSSAGSDSTNTLRTSESDLSQKLKEVFNVIIDGMKALLEERPLKNPVFDRAGARGEGQTDEDRSKLLWWTI